MFVNEGESLKRIGSVMTHPPHVNVKLGLNSRDFEHVAQLTHDIVRAILRELTNRHTGPPWTRKPYIFQAKNVHTNESVTQVLLSVDYIRPGCVAFTMLQDSHVGKRILTYFASNDGKCAGNEAPPVDFDEARRWIETMHEMSQGPMRVGI